MVNVPIGTPLKNYRVYILDNNYQLVPIGVIGEIYIAGEGVARGYIGNPELTAERFVPDIANASLKMYRTGDLGKWTDDGNVIFVGRKDHQVKIRGFRIELEEIQHKILSHKAVKDAVVIAKKDHNGIGYLCAYVVGKTEDITAKLRKYLANYLPEYMIPHSLSRSKLSRLPTTAKSTARPFPSPKKR